MQIIIAQALAFLGTPYLYGGKHPSQGGLDCSGLTHIIGRSVGLFESGAMSAQQQYDWLLKASGSKVGTLKTGSFIFYGKSVKEITHVAYALDLFRVIESGGGDGSFSKVDPNQQAARNAGVRIRLISMRKDVIAQIYPSYAAIGLI